MIYDRDALLDELNIPKIEKQKIIEDLKKEFPNDEMLFELHLFRTVRFMKNRKIPK